MSESKTWFVEFPTYRYKEDVSALAREKGLRVLDAKFDNGKGAKGPKLTLKPEFAKQGKSEKQASE